MGTAGVNCCARPKSRHWAGEVARGPAELSSGDMAGEGLASVVAPLRISGSASVRAEGSARTWARGTPGKTVLAIGAPAGVIALVADSAMASAIRGAGETVIPCSGSAKYPGGLATKSVGLPASLALPGSLEGTWGGTAIFGATGSGSAVIPRVCGTKGPGTGSWLANTKSCSCRPRAIV